MVIATGRFCCLLESCFFLVVVISLLVEDNDCHYQMIIQCNYMATVVCVQCTYKHA